MAKGVNYKLLSQIKKKKKKKKEKKDSLAT